MYECIRFKISKFDKFGKKEILLPLYPVVPINMVVKKKKNLTRYELRLYWNGPPGENQEMTKEMCLCRN